MGLQPILLGLCALLCVVSAQPSLSWKGWPPPNYTSPDIATWEGFDPNVIVVNDSALGVVEDLGGVNWTAIVDQPFTDNNDTGLLEMLVAAWTRADCKKVADVWLQHKVIYSQTPKVRQYISHGQGLYRPDCSGFVSAAWDYNPPGMTTSTFKVDKIHAKHLTRCDALLKRSGHIALFWGWNKGLPVVVEEHDWHLPIVRRSWSSSYYHEFQPVRRPHW
jgi:hypothetical protein